MIKVVFHRTPSGMIQSVTMKGHANFAENGSDIVCAAATAVSFGTANAIETLTGIDPVAKQGGDGGYLKVVIPQDISVEAREKIEILLQGMLISLETIEKEYHKYIQITLK